MSRTTTLLDRAGPGDRAPAGRRFTTSATVDGRFTTSDECLAWLAEQREIQAYSVERVPFDQLAGWHFAPDTGNLMHHTGRFFTIEGLEVQLNPFRVPSWTQPIIVQREIGILGILVKEFDGVLHCLMQAKMEPGNRNLVQLSPTVQATRSNYTRVHKGRTIPYLEYFTAPRSGRVIADSLQSEQGGWFLHKRNRNIVVETDEDVEVLPGFRWMTVAQVQRMLRLDDVVNMDARTVLSIMPFERPETTTGGLDPFRAALLRSLDPEAPTQHTVTEAISWLTENKARFELHQRRIPLLDTAGWHRTADEIAHVSGGYFSIVGVDVRARDREVGAWMQPLLRPAAPGRLVLLTRQINGVLHVLLQARPAAGALDIVEAAPTVHCTPQTFRTLPTAHRPQFLDYVLDTPERQVRFDTWLSEEGGRFLHALNRYQIIEVEEQFPTTPPPNFMWLGVHQLMTLLQFGNCLNVEARSLLACLHTLW
ncbi:MULTISPECIES: NDP-hexose 2,3-dehydratase family protein [Dactylosporangium]|uniref:NDP-hexose 2,3-dehydratase n=2 Tax=Dactylosporangium TaxID=35753 RepID=A0A9W6KV05_9ACTN|nr:MULTISPECIES: NDP-hexose 2,3-dehydratase family protein [Dactylosporangium]GLL07717.1 NDP-hexose 2,3-dehydratase [Dactylosporangium matsuzakiense]